jgi:hypothetical protein
MKKILSSRYTFDIISLSANSKNKLIEIEYNYTGVLLIPKHLKKTVKSKKFSVSGLFTINANIKDLVLNKNYKNISKKEVVDFLKKNLRQNYILGMKEIINKQIFSGNKKINVLPWK